MESLDDDKIVYISSGGNHLACVTELGKLYLLSREDQFSSPVLKMNEKVEKISLGWTFGLILTNENLKKTTLRPLIQSS